MRAWLIVVGLLAVSVAVAGRPVRPGGLAADATAPAVLDPVPFDHSVHDEVMRDKHVPCVTCHAIGARTEAGAPDEPLPIPFGTCHGCHLRQAKGAPRAASEQCLQCHANRAELYPANHRVGWMQAHAIEARALGSSCDSCHETRTCVECHENRGALSRTPHPPGFRSTHGIEARVDPASCSSCHVESSCSACHASGVIPW